VSFFILNIPELYEIKTHLVTFVSISLHAPAWEEVSEKKSLFLYGIIQASRPKVFTSLFSLPAYPLHQRLVQCDSSRLWAFSHTTTTIPALPGIDYDRWFALHRIGDQYIYLTYLYTLITPVAEIKIEYHRISRGQVESGKYLAFAHFVTSLSR